jgi:F-type H+-transporting ATPase subunit alpha
MQELLKQPQYQPVALDKQVISIWAVNNGILDKVPVSEVKAWEAAAHAYLDASHPEIGQTILRTKDLSDDIQQALRIALTDFNQTWVPASS